MEVNAMKLSRTSALLIAFAVFLASICDAKIWYQHDFEPDEGDWSLQPGTALSTKHSHSPTHSIVSNAKGENGRYAEIFLDMIPKDAKIIVDVIWVYHDGKNTDEKVNPGGTHHLSSWASKPGTVDWFGPHLVASKDNEIGFWPFDKPNSWSSIKKAF
jgi:hypothetical protein